MTAYTLPSHLGARSRAWAQSVLDDAAGDVTDTELKLLVLAAEALDRAATARRLVEREGITYADRFGAPRVHPAVAIERDARNAFARLAGQLGLDSSEPEGPHSYRGANGRTYRRKPS